MTRSHHLRAQSLTEYAALLVLLAVVVIVAIKNFGWRVEERVSGSSVEVEYADEDRSEK